MANTITRYKVTSLLPPNITIPRKKPNNQMFKSLWFVVLQIEGSRIRRHEQRDWREQIAVIHCCVQLFLSDFHFSIL